MSLPICGGHSFTNGIMFYSKQYPNYVAMATIDENQNIKTQWLLAKEAKKEEDMLTKQTEKGFDDLASKIFLVMFAPIALIVLIYFLDVDHTIGFLRIFDGIIIPFFIFSYISIIFSVTLVTIMLPEKLFGTNSKKIHAAEHMMIHAYGKLHRLPSIEELRKYSRVDKYCGTNFISLILFCCIIFLSHILLKLDLTLCCKIILAFDICMLLGGFNFVQLFITEPPTDSELKLAIECFKVWIENEQKSKENSFS